MSRRFHELLARAARVRGRIEEETRRTGSGNAVLLLRLRRLHARLKTRLASLTQQRLIAIASAPRLVVSAR